MARYPMRSVLARLRGPARAVPVATLGRANVGRWTGAHPRSRSGFAAYRLRHHRLRAAVRLRIVAQGCIATSGGPLADRLRIIHARVAELIAQHSPQEIAVERVFLSKNADSALKLGQARGAALAAVPAGARGARIRTARHQARGGGRGWRGESPGGAHGQAAAANRHASSRPTRPMRWPWPSVTRNSSRTRALVR